MGKKDSWANQRGFTLVEIIAVLIILGILSAVAVPRYMSLTVDARNSAAQAAVAEGKARVNQLAASYLLQNATLPAASDFSAAQLGTNAGDFTIAYDVSGTTSVSLTATGVAGGPAAGGTATGVAILPTN
jgi:prepilin-type N-terminal cleavage/methylation domain-containing protein